MPRFPLILIPLCLLISALQGAKVKKLPPAPYAQCLGESICLVNLKWAPGYNYGSGYGGYRLTGLFVNKLPAAIQDISLQFDVYSGVTKMRTEEVFMRDLGNSEQWAFERNIDKVVGDRVQTRVKPARLGFSAGGQRFNYDLAFTPVCTRTQDCM